MKDELKKINLEKIVFYNQEITELSKFTKEILNTFRMYKIDPEDKNILYLRRSNKKGLVGIQIGEDEFCLDDYLIYKYDTIETTNGFFLSIRTFIGEKVTFKAEMVNKNIVNDIIDCFNNIEKQNLEEDPERECKVLTPIKPKKKANVLKRLFNRE